MDLFVSRDLTEENMLSPKVKNYIGIHSFCSEYLFKDWEAFLDILYAEGGHVSSILWWDYCKKSEQRFSVGSGGYSDPENSEYMYAETHLFKDGLETNTLAEIKEYIIREKKTGFRYGSKFKSHELMPSFYLDE